MSIILFAFGFVSLLIHSGYYLFSDKNYNDWRILEVLILFLISIYFYFNHHKISSYLSKTTILYKSIVILIFFGLISAIIQAEYLSRALRDWSLYSCIIISVIGLAFIIKSHPKTSNITLIIMCCAPILFIIGFLYQIFFYFAIPIEPRISVLLTWQAQFSNDRIYGDTTLPIVFMLAALVSKTQNMRFKYFLLGLFFAVSIMLMFSGGRGVFISCAVSIIFGFILNKTIRKKLIYFSISLTASFIISLLLISFLSGDLSQGTIFRSNSSGRNLIIQLALKNLINNPILGIGPAQFLFIFNTTTIAHPHNLALQILTEWGFIAFISFTSILFSLFLPIIKLIRNEKQTFNIFIFLGAVSFFINCNFNGAHVYPSSQIYGIFITAWLFSIYFFPVKNTITQEKNIALHLSLIAPIAISITLLVTTYLTLGCAGGAPVEAGYGGPRFWLIDAPHDDTICKPFSEIDFSFNGGK